MPELPTAYAYDVRGVYVAAEDTNRIQVRLLADGIPVRTWRIGGDELLRLLLTHGAGLGCNEAITTTSRQ